MRSLLAAVPSYAKEAREIVACVGIAGQGHTVVARKRLGAYVMNEFGQKGKVPLSERLSVSPEEASALTGIGLTSIREAITSGNLRAKKHGRRTIVLPDDLRVWLKTLPDARKSIEESPA
jgi:hypothetical protein